MATRPKLEEWDARKHHGVYPPIDSGDLTWNDMEAIARTDSKLLSLVRQARASALLKEAAGPCYNSTRSNE